MPQLAKMTVNSVEYKPRSIKMNVATLANSSGALVGDKLITVSDRESDKRRKVTLRVMLPKVVNQTVDGVSTPVVQFTDYADITLNSSLLSTKAERTALRLTAAGILADAQIVSVVDDAESLY